jgi:small-conductance mechanosensitive channel
MTAISDWLQSALGLSPGALDRITDTLLAILILWAIRRIVMWVVWRRVEDVRARYRWQKVSSYIVVPVGILVVGRIWIEGFSSVATFLGLVSAGIAIALKDLLGNLAGWVFILWRRPFETGDRIQIGDQAGDVIDIRIFQFTVLEIGNWVDADQSTGRVIHIPNGKVLTEVLANYSKGFQYIWNELPVLITFESNWQKAKDILEEIAQQHAAHLTRDAAERIKEVSRRFNGPLPVRAAPPPEYDPGRLGRRACRLRQVRRHRFRLPDTPLLRQPARGEVRRPGAGGARHGLGVSPTALAGARHPDTHSRIRRRKPGPGANRTRCMRGVGRSPTSFPGGHAGMQRFGRRPYLTTGSPYEDVRLTQETPPCFSSGERLRRWPSRSGGAWQRHRC